MRSLMRFAGVMGPLSSAFDMLTFAVLLLVFHAVPEEFRTVWFLELMATQILAIFITARLAGRGATARISCSRCRRWLRWPRR